MTTRSRFNKAFSAADVSSQRVWLALSLAFSVFYGVLCLHQAFNGDYVVQDDARQHVFWMRRFLDPTLFPNDWIADYFQSVAPAGYTLLYRLPASLGIDPMFFNKLLPIAIGLVTTVFSFGVAMQIMPMPIAAFASTLLLNQAVWMKDGIASATPRAFAMPLVLACLYYLMRRDAKQPLWIALLPFIAAIGLLGLFYPHNVFIVAGLLVLLPLRWQRRLSLSSDRRDWIFAATGLVAAFLVLLPFALKVSAFGPAIAAAEARQLPEFLPGGRTPFFHENPWEFWLDGRGSGFMPSSMPILVWLSLVLPVLLRFPNRFPLAKQITARICLLPQLVAVSFAMFLIAHAVVFKLHLPSRYPGASWRIVFCMAGGMALVILLDKLVRVVQGADRPSQRWSAIGLSAVLGLLLIIYPVFLPLFPSSKYITGQAPDLYRFFAQQPSDILIASIAKEGDNVPSFAQRSILSGEEYAIPYHVGYYREFRQRTLDLIAAQYSSDPAAVSAFINQYGIDFWLLDRDAFREAYLRDNYWLMQYQPVAKAALRSLKRGDRPVLSRLKSCAAFSDSKFTVLEAACILESSSTQSAG